MLAPAGRTTLAALGFLLLGCAQPAPAPPRTLVVAVTDATQAAAERVASLARERIPGLVLRLRPGNTASALAALRRGDAAVALVDGEVDASPDLTVIALGEEPVAIIVNPANPIANASRELLAQLYSGRLQDWSEVGGPPGPIILLTREEGDGARTAFERIVLQGRTVTGRARLAPSERLMVQQVAALAGAIGYVGLGAVDARVKVVPLDMKRPGADSTYPLLRPVLLVTVARAESDAKALIQLATSEAGRAALRGEEENRSPVR
jgi:phosphate transport system substrate-binding protein